ncbi:MAG: DUF1858 domain-containing protein [Candidatus Pacearchaeota archaeon]
MVRCSSCHKRSLSKKSSRKPDNSLITEKTIITDIISKNPKKMLKISQLMIEHGLYCVGCMGGYSETLEQGCLSHGMSKKEIDKIVKEINKILKEKN